MVSGRFNPVHGREIEAGLSFGPGSNHDSTVREDHGSDALLNPGEAGDFFETTELGSFDPSDRGAFNHTNARWLAEFSRLVYRRERDEVPTRAPGFRNRGDFLAAHGWSEATVLRTMHGVPQAALFRRTHPDVAVLAFRGTLGLRDMLTDVRWLLEEWAGPGHVHQGFKDAHAGLWPFVRRTMAEVRCPLFLTGHSLGGALATMTAVLSRVGNSPLNVAALYTFGSPRVGDHALGAALEGLPHFRVVNDTDVIPRLPPMIRNPVLPYFQHTGQLHHLVAGAIRVYPPGEDPFSSIAAGLLPADLKRLLADAASRPGQLPRFLTEHAPANYVAKLAHVSKRDQPANAKS